MKPTKKQRSFIAEMCYVLNVENPNCKTIQEASNWISANLFNYNLELRSRWASYWEAEDYYEAGMQVYDEYEG